MIMRRLAVDVAWLFLFGLILHSSSYHKGSLGKMTRGNELLLFSYLWCLGAVVASS